MHKKLATVRMMPCEGTCIEIEMLEDRSKIDIWKIGSLEGSKNEGSDRSEIGSEEDRPPLEESSQILAILGKADNPSWILICGASRGYA